jgi:hypothetical protein
VNPLPEAAPLNETVQELVPGVLMVELPQFKLFKDTDTGTEREIAPEPPLPRMGEPVAVVDTTLPRRMGIGLVPGIAEIWNVAVATTPSVITLSFNPAMRQLLAEQERDFPALAVDAPGINVMPVMSGDTAKDH